MGIKVIAAVLLVSLMFHTGLQINRGQLMTILKSHGLIGRALLANFIIVPILGVLLVHAFALNDSNATGFLLMAISPGVPFLVLSGGEKKHGSVELAVTLALLLPLVSVVTVPLTAELILPVDETSRITATQLVLSLGLFQLLPLLFGILVNTRTPKIGQYVERPVGIVVLIAMALVLWVLYGPLTASITTIYGSRGMLAALALTFLSLVIGYALGGPQPETRRTLSIGTNLRNVGLALTIASTSFSADRLIGAAALSYLLVQFLMSVAAGFAFGREIRPIRDIVRFLLGEDIRPGLR